MDHKTPTVIDQVTDTARSHHGLAHMQADVQADAQGVPETHDDPEYSSLPENISDVYETLTSDVSAPGSTTSIYFSASTPVTPPSPVCSSVCGHKGAAFTCMSRNENYVFSKNADFADLSLLAAPLQEMDDSCVKDPFEYLSTVPGKNIRSKAIDGLNLWLQVPEHSVQIIKSTIDILHSASLMLDDLVDGSVLRRGKPSVHMIYGLGITVNSAGFSYVEALVKLQGLRNYEAVNVFTEEARKLFIGQSHDIYWTREMLCPTVIDYLRMIDGKTGGLFRMLARLLVAVSPKAQSCAANLDHIANLLGRYFQIRDDYQNLCSPIYAAQKGSYEDLDEGKFSLPLIHTWHSTTEKMRLRGLMQRRRIEGKLTDEQKALILDIMRKCGSFDYTLAVLRALYREIEREICKLEKAFEMENPNIKAMLKLLDI